MPSAVYWGVRFALGFLILLVLACSEAPVVRVEPPPVEATRVDNPPTFSVEMACHDLLEGETAAGTSPEGDLWLLRETEVRVIRTDGTSHSFPHRVPSTIVGLSPRSDLEAVAASAEGFWRLGAEGPSFVYVPEALRDATFFCGDPEIDGQAAIITEAGLFERQAGEWFMVSPAEDMDFLNVDWLAGLDGACRGRTGGMWFTTRLRGERSKLYRVDGTSVATYDVPEGISGDPIVGTDFVAVPAGDTLLFAGERGPLGSDWVPVQFAAGAVDGAAVAGDVIWVAVGNHLYRFTDGSWFEASLPLVEAATQTFAHSAGGVWLHNASQVCHVGPESMVRLRGLRPYQVYFHPTADVLVQIVGGDATSVSATIDGGGPRNAVATEDGWLFDDLMMGRPGWHEFEVRVDDEVRRRSSYRIVAGDVSFSRDVAPIAERYCATAACHGATEDAESVPLITYDHWVEAAFQINERVSRGSMPQDAPEDWLPSQATTIVDWIQGGRQP